MLENSYFFPEESSQKPSQSFSTLPQKVSIISALPGQKDRYLA